ncbi:MAG: LicD family protein [Firmicutes bacterium]|nr:LicD family protein [Bacillota bacterium]
MAPLQSVFRLNQADFCREWVEQMGTGRELAGITFAFYAPCEVVQSAACAILKAHGASYAQEPELAIRLDGCFPSGQTGKRIVFLSALDGEVQEPDTAMVVSIPPLYGAGLPESWGTNATLLNDPSGSGMHVLDFFRALIRAAAEYAPGCKAISPEESPETRQERLDELRLLAAHPQRRYYDDTAYGGKLRQLQLVQMKCLLELDRVCRENGITYFLGGGTLLGAVRHQGFIPWDDDVDVMMSRADFDRLAQIAPQAVDAEFFFQNSRTDAAYHSPFAKLRIRGTRFTTPFSSRFPEMHNEISIDIFAHDAGPRSPFLLKIHIFLTRFTRSMVYHRWDGSPLQFYGKLPWLCAVVSAVTGRMSMRRLEQIQHWVMTFWNRWNTGRLYDGMGEHLSHGSFDAGILEEGTQLTFEGHSFPAPKRYDEYLRFSYGEDYMQWPRPGLRGSHHAAVDFSLGPYEQGAQEGGESSFK